MVAAALGGGGVAEGSAYRGEAAEKKCAAAARKAGESYRRRQGVQMGRRVSSLGGLRRVGLRP